MASYNRVVLVGNITRDIEIRYTPSGAPVCEIGLAVNERRKNPQGEWVNEVSFIDVTLWNRTAEVASEYLTKGSQVLIEGRLRMDSWEQDGQKRTKLRVVADQMVMMGSRGDQAQSQGNYGGQNANSGYSGGYGNQSGFAGQGGYAPQQGGYSQQGNYSQQGGFGGQGGYPPQQGGFGQQGFANAGFQQNQGNFQQGNFNNPNAGGNFNSGSGQAGFGGQGGYTPPQKDPFAGTNHTAPNFQGGSVTPAADRNNKVPPTDAAPSTGGSAQPGSGENAATDVNFTPPSPGGDIPF